VLRLLLLSLLGILAGGSVRADRIDDLGRVLAGDPNWKVRMQAASVLGRLRDKRGVPALVRALSDGSEAVRGVAAGALGELGDPSAQAALKRALKDPSQLVRDQAQVALDSLGPAAAVEARRETPPAAEPARNGVRVEIGAITSRTSRLPGDLAERLRGVVAKNLAQTPGVMEAQSGGSFVLDTSVTRLTRKTGDDSVEIDCEVSLILGRLPGKAIVLTTSGAATSTAARATYTPQADRGMILTALEGAVQGAWGNLAAFFNKTSARR
jgi:HEAT repeat protein